VLSGIRLEADPEALPPLARRCRAQGSAPEEGASAAPALPPVPVSPFVAALTEGLDSADLREYRVLERDGWRCTVPGCTSYRNLHAHHVVFRSAGGRDEDAKLTTLCAAHHHHGVHTGVIRVSGRAPDGLVFELPVGRFASGDRVIATG
jgi:hypothetical protein